MQRTGQHGYILFESFTHTLRNAIKYGIEHGRCASRAKCACSQSTHQIKIGSLISASTPFLAKMTTFTILQKVLGGRDRERESLTTDFERHLSLHCRCTRLSTTRWQFKTSSTSTTGRKISSDVTTFFVPISFRPTAGCIVPRRSNNSYHSIHLSNTRTRVRKSVCHRMLNACWLTTFRYSAAAAVRSFMRTHLKSEFHHFPRVHTRFSLEFGSFDTSGRRARSCRFS